MTDLTEGLVAADELPAHMEENRVARRARVNRPKWNPKQWHPVYEEVVLLDILGYKNTEIAKEKGFTPVHVSNILNTNQAKTIRQIVIARMETRRDETVVQRMERLADRAMKRVEEVIDNDTLAEKNPLGVFDRAVDVLKAAKKIDTNPAPTTINNTLQVTSEAMKSLMDAMSSSERVRARHTGLEGKQEIHVKELSKG